MAHTAHTDPDKIRERYDSPEDLERKVDQLAALVKKSQHMVCFTGAGISTSAGIPDFRGPEGKWTREAQGLQPKRGVSTVSAFPTPTHMSLVQLQRAGILKYLISQNCDGLHRRSGMPADAISELHGNSNMEVCESCGQSYFRDYGCHRAGRSRDHFTGRFCSRAGCDGALLEYTIDFGQHLPARPLERASEHAHAADLHLALGSSLTVSPACNMPEATATGGGDLVIVNLQQTPLDKLATLKISAKTDTVMTMLMERLAQPVPPFRLQRRLVAGMREDTVFVKTVDVHDPSLELSLARKVEWPQGETWDYSALPVTLHWNGHYHEPSVTVPLDLSSSPMRDIHLVYDPYERSWTIGEQRRLEGLPSPSASVSAMQEHGQDYTRSHFKYCVDGIAKANAGTSRSKCESAAKEWQAKSRASARAGVSRGETVTNTVRARPSAASAASAPGGERHCDGGSTAAKIPIPGRPGELKKVATPAQSHAMDEHARQCSNSGCAHVWRGPWGPFIGGDRGRTVFDLTSCLASMPRSAGSLMIRGINLGCRIIGSSRRNAIIC